MSLDTDIYREPALQWVNLMRERYSIGAPLTVLPVGIPDSACDCTLARALHCMVNRTEAKWYPGELGWPEHTECLPGPVAEFVKAFDNYQYDDLVDWTAVEAEALDQEDHTA